MSKCGLCVIACLGLVLSAKAQPPDPATSVLIVWTAAGDDSVTGQAAAYDVRYLAGELTEATWSQAIQVPAPFPSLAGLTDSIRVTGLQPGTTYQFALKTLDEVLNTSTLSNIVTWNATVGVSPPPTAQLQVQAGPNPFRRQLLIQFNLASPTRIKLAIYDMVGRQICTLLDGLLPPGSQTAIWDAHQIPPGVYWYRLIRGDRSEYGKVVHLD